MIKITLRETPVATKPILDAQQTARQILSTINKLGL